MAYSYPKDNREFIKALEESGDMVTVEQEVDWERPFLDQLLELQAKTPHFHTYASNVVNCDFADDIFDSKNVYMSRSCANSEDLYYIYRVVGSKDSMDITYCYDLGSKEALLLSPSHYRTYIKPWHKKLCEKVHELGASVHLHCHGAIQTILDDLVECGFDFVNPFDPEEGWDIEQVLKDYSKHFVVVGGFPTKFWYWPADKQESYLEQMTKLAQKYTRFIFMDSGGIPEDISPKDHERILETSRKLRGVENITGCV